MSRIFPVALSVIAFGALCACSDTMSSPAAYSSAHQVAQGDVPTICAGIDNSADRQVCVNNQPPAGPAWGAD
jgi:hypothetical protein